VNHHIVVDDCIIQHGGRLHPSACGVVLTHTQHCAVTHCDIGDFYYTGISAGWNWGYGDTASRETLVENNHIHHLGWAYLSDMGGFYGLGTSPGTIMRGNHVHHIASHRYGGWGLYNDEGSADTLMENNLVHDTWNAGFHQHYGYFNTVRNNIFAFGHTRADPGLAQRGATALPLRTQHRRLGPRVAAARWRRVELEVLRQARARRSERQPRLPQKPLLAHRRQNPRETH
jgi:hypothetical protein